MTLRKWIPFVVICAGWAQLATSTAQAQLVINEIDYDQPGVDQAEFIEIKNVGGTSQNLAGYTLNLINGANGGAVQYRAVALGAGELAAGDYFVVCGNGGSVANCDLVVPTLQDIVQNGAPDALALQLDGAVVDTVSYEGNVPGFTEGSGDGLVDSAAGFESLSRCADGADTDQNDQDFALRSATPGAANDCPGGGGGGGQVGACGDAATPIHAIQGSGDATPMAGQTVIIEGVVVGDFQDEQINGLFVQEEDADADADAATSEGIFVFEGALAVPANAGDVVRIRGQVAEFSSLTELTEVTDIVVCAQSGVASTSALTFPVAAVSDLERYEGMLVTVDQTLTVSENFDLGRFGSLLLSAGGRLYQPTQVADPGAPAQAVRDLNLRRRIILDDKSTSQNPSPIPYKDADNTRRVGDTLPSLTGILSGRFGEYRIQPTETVSFIHSNPRPHAPPPTGGTLAVVSFNVLNFFTTLDGSGSICGPSGTLECRGADSAAEYERQLGKLLNALELLGADVFGLIELENNPSASLQALVDGLNARLGAGTYAFVDTGSIGTDAIKLGFLYKTATVQPVGPHAILDSSVDPNFIDTLNRPALAQTFEELASGERFTAVNVHLKSKGSACDSVGDPDTGDLQGNCNGTRTLAAEAIADWLDTDPTGSGDQDFLVIGDFNAYAKEDPIVALSDEDYEPLVETMIGADASSYVFFGESGYLDHAFSSPSMSAQVAGVVEWHHNGDEPVVLDYNLEFKTEDPFDAADPFRASDHDSLVVGLALGTPDVAPRCRGLIADIYVREGVVIGGPLHGQPYRGTLEGTAQSEVLVGTDGGDVIHGNGGQDMICGRDGQDILYGDADADRLFGGRGKDVLHGRGGDDFLSGGRGSDSLYGGGGEDVLRGNRASDLLSGGAGRDTCNGGGGAHVADGTCELTKNVP